MSINEYVDVQIRVENSSITRASFGTPLIAAYTTAFPGRVREFGSLQELVDAGIGEGTVIYKKAAAMLSQPIRISSFKVGRRANAPNQNVQITLVGASQGVNYKFSVSLGDVTANVDYTVPEAGDGDSASLAIAAIINGTAGLNVTAADGGGFIALTPDSAGDVFQVLATTDNLQFDDNTADPGLLADLNAIYAEDAAWYGLVLDSSSPAEILVAAAWAETKDNMFLGQHAQQDVRDGTAATLGLTLRDAGYEHTATFIDKGIATGFDARCVGYGWPKDAGTINHAHNAWAGQLHMKLTTAEKNNLRASNTNFYTREAGLSFMFDGSMAKTGIYIDTTRGKHWLMARMRENILALLHRNERVEYTQKGVNLVLAEVWGILNLAVEIGVLSPDVPITVTAPTAQEAREIYGSRVYGGIEFTAQFTGAINEIKSVRGTISA